MRAIPRALRYLSRNYALLWRIRRDTLDKCKLTEALKVGHTVPFKGTTLSARRERPTATIRQSIDSTLSSVKCRMRWARLARPETAIIHKVTSQIECAPFSSDEISHANESKRIWQSSAQRTRLIDYFYWISRKLEDQPISEIAIRESINDRRAI